MSAERHQPEDSSSDTCGEDEPDDVVTREKRDLERASRKVMYYGNPNFSNKMQLYSRTKHFLAVYPDGSVRGTQDQNDLHTHLELTNAGDVGDVKIRGLESNRYVGMNNDGLLYSTNELGEDTVFYESFTGDYKLYASKKFLKEAYLELRNAGPVGYVRILGLLTRLYVAMDKQGRLYAENNMWIEGTVFVESVNRRGYKTYKSSPYANWYLGIKKSGKFKKGPKTGPYQKAIEFLSVRTKFQ